MSTDERDVIVEADGGSRGNPGPAGCGAVVKDAATGAVLAERAEELGVATNNVAEYRGLIAGLSAAVELGAGSVLARMDSKLVVEQMSGRWKIKNATLQPLALQARDIAGRFGQVRYEWIPRARNAHADRLANEAMDKQAGINPGDGAGDREDVTERAQAPAAVAWSGATGEPTRFLLLRHGQTELSAQRRYSGRGDVPLSELGVQQAAAAAKRLAAMDGISKGDEPVRIVASPLARARQTAQAVADALGAHVRTHHGLIETDFGAWEGLTFTEAAQRDPELHVGWLGDATIPPPGGESFEAVYRRVREARDELVAEHAGRTVVLVSHVTPIKSMLRLCLDAGPGLLYRSHLDLASLSIAEFYPDGNASLRLLNDTCHLD